MKKISTKMAVLMEATHLLAQSNKRIDNNLNLHGISLTEFLVLHQLHGALNQSMSRIELATSIGLSASGVTRLINPMEKIHLIEKAANPRDARKSMVRLTDAGLEIYADARTTYVNVANDLFSSVSDKKLTDVLNVLRSVNI